MLVLLMLLMLLMSSIDGTPISEFALIDGAPGSGSFVPEVINPVPTQHLGEVQCCLPDNTCTRRSPWNSGLNAHCLSGNNDAMKFTLQEAADMCASLGQDWSLCTRQQVENNHCQGKGCLIDHTLVWVLETPTVAPTMEPTVAPTIEPTMAATICTPKYEGAYEYGDAGWIGGVSSYDDCCKAAKQEQENQPQKNIMKFSWNGGNNRCYFKNSGGYQVGGLPWLSSQEDISTCSCGDNETTGSGRRLLAMEKAHFQTVLLNAF